MVWKVPDDFTHLSGAAAGTSARPGKAATVRPSMRPLQRGTLGEWDGSHGSWLPQSQCLRRQRQKSARLFMMGIT